MSGPWYESQGPDAKYVRQDIYNRIKSLKNKNKIYKYEKQKEQMIQKILFKHIPDSRNDFGSFRGYSTFVRGKLYNTVIKDLRIEYAYFIIEKKLIPYIIHHLYKPDGMMYNKTKKNTCVGKK